METARTEDGWQEISCLRGKLRTIIPKEWETMPEETKAKKFPYMTKPQAAFADLQADKVITFNLLGKQLVQNQVYTAIREMQTTIGRLYPESIKEQARVITTAAGSVGIFAFATGGIREDTYHSMFIVPADGRMMLGSFHLPAGQAQEGMAELMKVIKSIQIG